MFVDTVGFEFRYNSIDKLEYILSNLKLVQASYVNNGGSEKLYRRFKLFPEGKLINLKSYSENINIQPRIRKGSYFSFPCLYCEFSIPKFYYGTNCFTYNCNFKQFFKDFIEFLTSQSLVDSTPDLVVITRLDFTASFLFDSREELSDCLDFFTPPRIQQRKNGTFRYDTTLQFSSHWHSYKLYQKSDEMLKNKSSHKLSEEDFQKYFEASQNILRFEHTLRSAQLKRMIGLKSTDLISLEVFLNSDFYRNYDIISDIKRVFGDWEKEYRVYSSQDALDLIDFSFSRQYSKYFKFLSKIFAVGLEPVKNSMSKQAYYRYNKRLKSVGIDIEKLSFFIENKVIKQFSDTNYFRKERLIFFDKNR